MGQAGDDCRGGEGGLGVAALLDFCPCPAKFTTMTNIETIEKAVSNLPESEFVKFAAWFEAFEAERFDRRIEQDVAKGKLDRLAEAAMASWRDGKARAL